MDEPQKLNYENQSRELRAGLKQWEGDWAKTHHGRKPSRDDIKQNPDIAQQYKEYHKIRDILSGKTQAAPPPPRDGQSSSSHNRKRRATDASLSCSQAPSKRIKSAQTPLKSHPYSGHNPSAAATPSLSRKLFSPAVPTSIGPTPQRDGRVLGLFDLLDTATPSKSTSDTAAVPPLAGVGGTTTTATFLTVNATPSKPGASPSDLDGSTTKPSRTPMSSAKRNLLDSFMTPLKKRRHDGSTTTPDRAGGIGKTPRSSVSKQQFATPAFLRRAPLPSLDETGEGGGGVTSPRRALRLPRKPLLRGLSSVVAGLRRLEEEALDDELDALRELENEERRPNPNPKQQQAEKTDRQHVSEESAGAAVEVEDIQVESQLQRQQQERKPVLLGGFDDEALYDSPVEGEQMGRDGQPLRVFKKKGQKRTTRRVNMRPTRTRRPGMTPKAENQAAGEASGEDDDAVAETQVDSINGGGVVGQLLRNDASSSEFGGSDGEDEADEAKGSRPKKKEKGRWKKKNEKKKEAGNIEENSGTVERVVRKVKATAHANFRRLKLKNNGAKGGPGYNSKFRRRR